MNREFNPLLAEKGGPVLDLRRANCCGHSWNIAPDATKPIRNCMVSEKGGILSHPLKIYR